MASSYSLQQARYQYRLMSPLGTYPNDSISVDGATLFVENDLVVLCTTEDIDGVELFLKASMLLSDKAASDNLRFYAFPFLHQIEPDKTTDVDSTTIKQDISHKKALLFREKGNTVPEFDWYENSKGASLPPLLGGASYNWYRGQLNNEMVRDLFNHLKQHKCGRLKGALTALVQSNQISCHFQFHHQAVGLLLDALCFMQSIEGIHFDSAQLKTMQGQIGDTAEDYLISRQQLGSKVGPIDYHRIFVQTCTQLRKYLLSL